MKEVKFTKGEWHLPHFATAKDKNDCTCGFVLNEKYCGSIATIHYAKPDEFGDDPEIEEAKANARLICAAPDLFAALQGFINDFEGDYTMQNGEIVDNPMNILLINYKIAKKALNKAL